MARQDAVCRARDLVGTRVGASGGGEAITIKATRLAETLRYCSAASVYKLNKQPHRTLGTIDRSAGGIPESQ